MRDRLSKTIISILVATAMCSPVFAESLFKTGISQNASPFQPRSLFSSVRAKTIGDLITVLVTEDIQTSDNIKLSVKKASSMQDNYSAILNRILPGGVVPNMSNFGGTSDDGNSASISRSTKLKDTVTAQVVQILPNGNLVIQGKKTAINTGERMEIVLSGIIDPRLLDNMGRIDSSNVANLQVAIVGKGTISRSDSEGTMSKILRGLF